MPALQVVVQANDHIVPACSKEDGTREGDRQGQGGPRAAAGQYVGKRRGGLLTWVQAGTQMGSTCMQALVVAATVAYRACRQAQQGKAALQTRTPPLPFAPSYLPPAHR